MNVAELDKLLDIAEAAGALASGRKEEDVLHQMKGNGRAVAVAAQQVETYGRSNTARPWTEEEEAFLEEALGRLSIEEIGEYLGRSATAVKIRWTRCGFDAPSKQPGELTANQVATALGVDVHAVCSWIDDGILPGRELPMDSRRIRVVKQVTLYRWATNPMNWPYFENSVFQDTRSNNGRAYAKGTQRMGDRRLARLIERQKERWGDRWLSTGQVGEMHGVNHTLVNKYAREGRIPSARRWQNWRILESEARKVQFHTGKGSNSSRDWSPAGDVFMVLAAAIGITHTAIAAMMGPAYSDKVVNYRLQTLIQVGEVRHVAYDRERQLLWADWRPHRHRFPGLARAVDRFLTGDELGHVDRQYVRGVMLSWLCRQARGEDQEALAHKMTYGWNVTIETLREWHRQLQAWGIEPFAVEARHA